MFCLPYLHLPCSFGVRVFLLEPNVMLHLPKGCLHSFTKLSKRDMKTLLSLMEDWRPWEGIHCGVEEELRGLEAHLNKCDRMAQTGNDDEAVNFVSIASDWYVLHCFDGEIGDLSIVSQIILAV